jgi:hypothetical protein
MGRSHVLSLAPNDSGLRTDWRLALKRGLLILMKTDESFENRIGHHPNPIKEKGMFEMIEQKLGSNGINEAAQNEACCICPSGSHRLG